MKKSVDTNAVLIAACFSSAVSVALGAIGSHLLSNILTPIRLDVFDRAGYYLLVHSIAIISLIALKANANITINLKAIFILYAGTLLFCTSLYLVSFSDLDGMSGLKFAGMTAPIGGVMMIFGWILTGIKIFTK